MARPSICAPEVVTAMDGLPLGVPTGPARRGLGREQIIDVLRAGGLRFRDGARWRLAH
ncbi:hypothetical protein [Micromonospora globbae]|jgi:hypothetical protein|uniref:Recombinase domain-containing protein n=1 Tax=Micromonospora globbae TaxID=1894969 RepID=A0ABZ1S3J7_9ACTN|nr:hypothetical protein [Micromonospora globbae]WTF86051.1 hypothetical protein OH732_00035 [Micromonospora globbae]